MDYSEITIKFNLINIQLEYLQTYKISGLKEKFLDFTQIMSGILDPRNSGGMFINTIDLKKCAHTISFMQAMFAG